MSLSSQNEVAAKASRPARRPARARAGGPAGCPAPGCNPWRRLAASSSRGGRRQKPCSACDKESLAQVSANLSTAAVEGFTRARSHRPRAFFRSRGTATLSQRALPTPAPQQPAADAHCQPAASGTQQNGGRCSAQPPFSTAAAERSMQRFLLSAAGGADCLRLQPGITVVRQGHDPY